MSAPCSGSFIDSGTATLAPAVLALFLPGLPEPFPAAWVAAAEVVTFTFCALALFLALLLVDFPPALCLVGLVV